MSKKCARPECGKTVYPLEELKCLDKIWHKGCFKCAVCGMTLSMKNYKGYNKTPYCEAHYPKTVASVVADTPEMRRLAENTKNQSLVQYHADFEKQKGKKIDVVDDPETARHVKNMQVFSQAAYHHDTEKKEQMERIRPPYEVEQRSMMGPGGEQTETVMLSTSTNQHHVVDDMHQANGHPPQQQQHHRHHIPAGAQATAFTASAQHQQQHQQQQQGWSPYTAKQQQATTLVYSSDQGGQVAPQQRNVGRIDDYDPLNGQWGTIGGSAGPPQGVRNAVHPTQQQPPMDMMPPQSPPAQQIQQQRMSAGSGGMPLQQSQGANRGAMSALAGQPQQQQQMNNIRQQQQHPGGGQQHSPQYPPALKQQQQQPKQQPAFRAMYDYTAADTDEVTFVEGDVIINCQPVDEGWMTGTVKRTNQWGMLPANYVERVN